MDPDGMVALLNYREDGVTPYFTFFKDGLAVEKLVSEWQIWVRAIIFMQWLTSKTYYSKLSNNPILHQTVHFTTHLTFFKKINIQRFLLNFAAIKSILSRWSS